VLQILCALPHVTATTAMRFAGMHHSMLHMATLWGPGRPTLWGPGRSAWVFARLLGMLLGLAPPLMLQHVPTSASRGCDGRCRPELHFGFSLLSILQHPCG
jgi:hypothetical protein